MNIELPAPLPPLPGYRHVGRKATWYEPGCTSAMNDELTQENIARYGAPGRVWDIYRSDEPVRGERHRHYTHLLLESGETGMLGGSADNIDATRTIVLRRDPLHEGHWMVDSLDGHDLVATKRDLDLDEAARVARIWREM